jgi:hypothetical protein
MVRLLETRGMMVKDQGSQSVEASVESHVSEFEPDSVAVQLVTGHRDTQVQ